MFGTGITAKLEPLYLPGTVFVVVSVFAFFIQGMKGAAFGTAWKVSFKTILPASMALVFTVPMVQVFINSDMGAAGYAKMPIALADGVAAIARETWPIFAPFIGGLGAFVAGSNTVSNMMFSLFQFNMGVRINVLDPVWIVALQVIGGAAGNMICVHNVVAASAVAGIVGKEGVVIRKTLITFVYYALLPGFIGYAIVWTSQKGMVNVGSIGAVAIYAFMVFLIASNKRKKRQTE
jgi:lactate permease